MSFYGDHGVCEVLLGGIRVAPYAMFIQIKYTFTLWNLKQFKQMIVSKKKQFYSKLSFPGA